ncbi:MAG TPA: hypothetical protein VJU86_18455 [Pyrinomonadaceae bacterium]|nr:hypothetical protein [Pyrinomonadaceae bacterium]
MFNPTVAQHPSLPRILPVILLVAICLGSSGCGLFRPSKKVQVPQLLGPLTEADTPRLVSEVNRLANYKSIHGKVDIEFEDTSFAEVGIAEKYKQADGTVTLQRPGRIYLVISVPFIAKDIVQMTSDGETFRVAVLEGEEKYKKFLKGTNNATYEPLNINGDTPTASPQKKRDMTGKETVNALSNLRPQHLTEALLISPISDSTTSNSFFTRSEFYQEEPDTRPNAKKDLRIVKGYYLLEEVSQPVNGNARLLRRFWFDRLGGIRLARVQSFDERGGLITDVAYWDEKSLGETVQRVLPSRIEITRPRDKYKLRIVYQSPTSVEIDKEYAPEAFVLENRWQLPEVDLDERLRSKPASQPNSPR